MKKMQHITRKMSFAQVYEFAKEEVARNVGMMENNEDADKNVEVVGMNELSRALIFAKCYSRDGNTSNPEVANALEKMRDLESQLPSGARDEGPKDIYSQVLGEDKGGRVRMYGYGITAKQVYGVHSLGQSDIHRITMEKEALRIQLEEKDKLIQRLLRNVDLSGNDHSRFTKGSSRVTFQNSAIAESTQPSSTFSIPLQVGVNVLLKDMFTLSYIAKGSVQSLNPSKLVANEELGEDWCEVKINVPIKYDHGLIRKNGIVKVIGQAIGSSIAWPKYLVEVEDAIRKA
ncbi:hypothetical protein OROMI_018678 [Orobanche minor]